MRPIMLHLLRLVVVLVALSSTAGRAFASPEEDIDRTEDRRYDAMIRDPAALAGILADEFFYHRPNGTTTTKASYIAELNTGEVTIYKAERYDVTIRVYGELATVMGSTRLDIAFGKDRRDIDLRYLNVWVLRDGRWQLTARQSAFKTK